MEGATFFLDGLQPDVGARDQPHSGKKYGAVCQIGANAPMRLDELIEDYLVHLGSHIQQIQEADQD